MAASTQLHPLVRQVIDQLTSSLIAETDSKLKAQAAELNASSLRITENTAQEAQQRAVLADLATKIEEAQDLLEATEREAELVRTKTRGERDQILAQARSDADAVRNKYKRLVKDLEAA